MPCSQQHPIGFIVLCENIRNGRICHSPVQQLRISVNHRMVHRVRPAAKIFTDFTSIDFEAAKLSRQCTARYGKVSLCTLLYACFAYQPPIQRQILHSAVKYSTVQNWFPGDNNTGGILNFVTKRALCEGENSKMSWTQSETGSAITWKYPSCILRGDNSIGEFFSVALTSGHQQADTGTKMIHIGKNTRSTIISKGISAGHSQNSYRGLVKIMPTATNARNYTQCDSMLIGPDCGAHTFPYVECRNNSAQLEHEATTSRIDRKSVV